ncbi:MAG: response regulator [Acidobacteria bacterium]|nr:response regulator [Acidobacteriota bacterium]
MPTILIVEDDRALASTLELALAPLGPIVVTHDGAQAQAYLQSNAAPAAVLTDLDLPRVDGCQLIQWMRATPALLRVPVLAMSARNDDAGALAAGANRFIVKPFRLAQVRERLQELLNA